MSTCGQCKFAKMKADRDLKSRVCYGLPPQTFFVPAAGGRAMQLSSRPEVGPEDDACSVFQAKLQS